MTGEALNKYAYKLWADARASMLAVTERLHQRRLELANKQIELEKAKHCNAIQNSILSIVYKAIEVEGPPSKDGVR